MPLRRKNGYMKKSKIGIMTMMLIGFKFLRNCVRVWRVRRRGKKHTESDRWACHAVSSQQPWFRDYHQFASNLVIRCQRYLPLLLAARTEPEEREEKEDCASVERTLHFTNEFIVPCDFRRYSTSLIRACVKSVNSDSSSSCMTCVLGFAGSQNPGDRKFLHV
jgi:hypothetical protein